MNLFKVTIKKNYTRKTTVTIYSRKELIHFAERRQSGLEMEVFDVRWNEIAALSVTRNKAARRYYESFYISD